MNYKIMEESDLDKVVALYIDYYNNYEGSCWTEQTAYKRLHSRLTREGSYCLVLEDQEKLVGFIVGYLDQYDDIVVYELDEIVIDHACQKQGIGTEFIQELEKRVVAMGASMIQLQAVNDEMHDHFYGKLAYKNANNFVLKCKWLA